jgi:endo-1,3(4)-beta-glucanase
MTGIIGTVWSLKETLTTIQWNAPRPIDPTKVPDIRAALINDQNIRPGAQDPYFFGKQVALMGRLALIADQLGETTIANNIRAGMKSVIGPWLNGTNSDPLLYDNTWGGIVSRNGINNAAADFGQGYYNDHHFHYGYFVYAAAVIGKADGAWLQANKARIMDLVRDYANPSTSDPYYPVARYTIILYDNKKE